LGSPPGRSQVNPY